MHFVQSTERLIGEIVVAQMATVRDDRIVVDGEALAVPGVKAGFLVGFTLYPEPPEKFPTEVYHVFTDLKTWTPIFFVTEGSEQYYSLDWNKCYTDAVGRLTTWDRGAITGYIHDKLKQGNI